MKLKVQRSVYGGVNLARVENHGSNQGHFRSMRLPEFMRVLEVFGAAAGVHGRSHVVSETHMKWKNLMMNQTNIQSFFHMYYLFIYFIYV